MEYYLKKGEEVYGPAGLTLLQAWAADGRVAPEDHISDRADGGWVSSHTLPELDMNWKVELPDGTFYGPVHILALKHSFLEESLDPGAVVLDTEVDQSYPLSLALCVALIEQNTRLEQRLERLKHAQTPPGGDPAAPVALAGTVREQAAQIEVLEARNGELNAQLQEARDGQPVEGKDLARIAELEKSLHDTERKLIESEQHYATRKRQVEALKDELEARNREAAGVSPPPDSWQESMRQRDLLEKETARWKRLYEETAANTQAEAEGFEKTIQQLRTNEIDNSREIEQLKRHLQEHKVAQDRSGSGDADVRVAYQELSGKFDALLEQLSGKTRELEAALQARDSAEETLAEKSHRMEQDLVAEREASGKIRHQLGEVESEHRELLKSYRELNDKFIQLKDDHPHPAKPESAKGAKKPLRNKKPEETVPDQAETREVEKTPEDPPEEESGRGRGRSGLRLK